MLLWPRILMEGSIWQCLVQVLTLEVSYIGYEAQSRER